MANFYHYYNFLVVNCSAPSAANGMVIEPYSSTTEGATIYYKCEKDRGHLVNDSLKVSVCEKNGKWSPDPGDNYQLCTPPDPLTSTTEGQCSLYSHYTVSLLCVWNKYSLFDL